MNKLKLLVLLTMAAVTFATSPAQAAQFNITVPIRVSNLPPNIDAVLLACLLYTDERRNVGVGRQRVNITGGAYSGNATISFDVAAGQDPASATSYECTVASFVGYESGTTVHYFASGGSGSEFPLAADAPLRLSTGRLPIPH